MDLVRRQKESRHVIHVEPPSLRHCQDGKDGRSGGREGRRGNEDQPAGRLEEDEGVGRGPEGGNSARDEGRGREVSRVGFLTWIIIFMVIHTAPCPMYDVSYNAYLLLCNCLF